jgi:hypothetical protein
MPPKNVPDLAWQPPLSESPGRSKINWVNDIVSATEGLVTSQPGFKDMNNAVDMISGAYERGRNPEVRSRLLIPRNKRALREVIANISDIRAVDGFTTENSAQKANCELFNKVWKSVWFESKFPVAMHRCVQWFTVGGVSYISPVYRNLRLSARNKRGIAYDVYPVSDVLPFQMPMDNDIQGSYAVTMIKYMPTFQAHAKFPKFQHLLRPISRRRYSGNASKDRLALAERFRQDNLGKSSSVGGSWADEFNEIRYTYIRDLRVNDTMMPVPMGNPGSLESYVVPFLGQEIPTGDYNMGIPIKRKADIEDCYLYPNLRLIITQRGMSVPLYDGPAFDWHGMFPLSRFSADEWPWEPGYSLARDIFSIGDTQIHFERGMDQTVKQRMDPALMYDKNATNRKTMEQFDPYEERGRLGLEGGISETTVKTALPEQLLNLTPWMFEWSKYFNDSRSYLLGTDQMENLARAKMAAISGEVAQEAMEEVGPIVKDISRGMESPMQDLMQMSLSLILQYYPTGRIMNYVGADGVTMETFDLNPETLVPSHAATENPANGPSAFTRMQRVQMFMDNFSANITPGSLHGIVQTSQKLLLMQLQRAGFMIDSGTVAKAMDIPNYGEFDGNTVIDKWWNEQKKKLEIANSLKQLQDGLNLQTPGLAPPQVTPLAPGNGPKPGRPPSGTRPPELKTKGSAEGQRAVVSESG